MAGHDADSDDAMTGDQPTLADVAQRWPRWEAWQGINLLWHARIKGATPPVMVHGEEVQDLMDEIQRREGQHDRA